LSGVSRDDPTVGAVIVTYHPDLQVLGRSLLALVPQTHQIVVVDNGSACELLSALGVIRQHSDITLIANAANTGIAAAQNQGVAYARARGCSHVIFFDQDSVPSPGLVSGLLDAAASAPGRSVDEDVVVGPCISDDRLGVRMPFVRFGMLGVKRYRCAEGSQAVVPADFLIASGVLIPLRVFDKVGLMDESLFIDNVDLEWCFRARSRGVRLFGVCGVRMAHSLGDRAFRVGDHVIHYHGPVRQYYMMRNRVLLYRREYTPKGWIVQDLIRVLVKFALFSLVFAPRGRNIAMMLRGIWHGLRGVTGPFR
jgi:rhamnosyltransferase